MIFLYQQQTPLSQPKIKLDIPVPRINNMESYLKEMPADYQLPRAYVRYHRLTDDEWKNTLEYVCDQEDEAWLQKNARFGGGGGVNTAPDAASKPKLSIDLLERMMDALEKETAFDAIITVSQADALFRIKIPELYLLFPSKPRQGQVTTKHVLNDVYGVRTIILFAYVSAQNLSKIPRPWKDAHIDTFLND